METVSGGIDTVKMMDGHNVAPGTPVENLNAMAEAAGRFGSL